mmetsp:Transcript_26936/g.39611  ORF Transcript_26936/g.39611 Transcript_26936/m.39611 type:complete len:107 (+) Transcript_26936:3-323(+)
MCVCVCVFVCVCNGSATVRNIATDSFQRLWKGSEGGGKGAPVATKKEKKQRKRKRNASLKKKRREGGMVAVEEAGGEGVATCPGRSTGKNLNLSVPSGVMNDKGGL